MPGLYTPAGVLKHRLDLIFLVAAATSTIAQIWSKFSNTDFFFCKALKLFATKELKSEQLRVKF